MKKKWGLIGICLLLFLTLTGAKQSEKSIQIKYKPNTEVKASPKETFPEVKLFFGDFKDERSHPGQIGENLEEKDKRVVIVTDPQAAAQMVQAALSKEFKSKGFAVVGQPGQAHKLIGGSLVKFWTVETNRYRTDTQLKIEVRDPEGRVYFSKLVAGSGKNFGRSLSETNYTESASDSLVAIVEALFSDREFLSALAEKPAPSAVAAAKAVPVKPSDPGQAPAASKAVPAPPDPIPTAKEQTEEKKKTKKSKKSKPPEDSVPLPAKQDKPAAEATLAAVPGPMESVPAEKADSPSTLTPPQGKPAAGNQASASPAVAPAGPKRPAMESPPAAQTLPAVSSRPVESLAKAPLSEPESPEPKRIPEPSAPQAETPVHFIGHKVRTGETLATIAFWYSGETTYWPEIAKYNPGLSPFKLKEGEMVKIPDYLATVHSEPPVGSTAGSVGSASKPAKKIIKKSAQPAASPPSQGPVFGPK